MIDFTEVTGWNVGNTEVVKASLNGVVVWGHDVVFKEYYNTQTPASLSSISPIYTYSPAYATNNATRLKITVKRVGTTREYSSGGVTYKEGGYLNLYRGQIPSDSTGPLYTNKLKGMLMPTNVGDENTYSVDIPSGTTQVYIMCEARGYYGTSQEYYGYIGNGVFKFTIALNA